MKKIHPLYPALLIALFPGMVKSEDEPADKVALADVDAGAALAKLAETKVAATLRLDVMVNPKRGLPLNGVFISDDGLALIELRALSQKAKPTVLTARGKRLELGTILKLFPSQGLALIKFKHRPEAHLEFAGKEPVVGETIAVVPTDLGEQGRLKGGIPPVVGPILARRNSLDAEFGYRGFTETLSLGSRLTLQQRPHVTSGTIAINRAGALVATFDSQYRFGSRTLLLLNPVVALGEAISKIDKKGKGLPFPLPDHETLFPPFQTDPDYNRLVSGGAAIAPKERLRLLKDLLERYPKSHSLKDTALTYYDPENPLVDLDDFPEPEPGAPVALQVSVLSCRVFFLDEPETAELAIKVRKAAIALSPKDYPADRYMLARQYLNLKRFEHAETMLREAYSSSSDNIEIAELYRRLLVENRKWDRLKQVEKRIEELDEVFRPR